MPALELRRRRYGARGAIGLHACAGTRSARSPAKLSDATCPSATSSDNASSTLVRNSEVPTTSSSKKDAPCWRINDATACAAGLMAVLSALGDSEDQSAAWRRASIVMGVVRTGEGFDSLPSGRAFDGRNRAQVTWPARQRSSSQSDS